MKTITSDDRSSQTQEEKMETGKNCKLMWSGDTGFGGIFVKIPYCENTYTPKASGDRLPAKKVEGAKAEENSRNWLLNITGFNTFVLSSIWRYWFR